MLPVKNRAEMEEKRDDLYSRYRMAKTSEDKEKVFRDMQRFNLDCEKIYRESDPADHGYVTSAGGLAEAGEGLLELREERWRRAPKIQHRKMTT